MKHLLKGLFSLVLVSALCPLAAHQHGDTRSTHSNWQKRSAIHFLSQFDIRGDEQVLDVGAGDGKVTAYLSIKIPDGNIVGADRCSDCVKEASQTYRNSSFPNLTFTTADATELPFDQEFDLITSFSTIHLVQDKAAAFRSIKRSLKPNGRTLLLCPLNHGLNESLAKLGQRDKWKQYIAEFNSGWHFSTAQDFRGLLADVELDARHFHISRLDEVYESEEEFKEGVSRWLPHLSAIPEEKQAEFLEELLEVYAEETPFDTDGRIHFYVDRLEIEAYHLAPEPMWEDVAEHTPAEAEQAQ